MNGIGGTLQDLCQPRRIICGSYRGDRDHSWCYSSSNTFVEASSQGPTATIPESENGLDWVRVWLLLGLEFELAADIVRSAISPSWTQIGQLAAIAIIRTFLNYFLEKDVERYAEPPLDA